MSLHAAQEQPFSIPASRPAPLVPVRVLLVDSDPSESSLVRREFAACGYGVTLAETGARGLVEARTNRHHAVVLAADLGNGADGTEICRRIRSLPALQSLPVVVYSDVAPTDLVDRMYDAGCDVFVGKTQRPALAPIVQRLLGQRERLQQLEERNRQIEMDNRRLAADRAKKTGSSASSTRRESSTARPDGVLIVDGGRVLHADRGACELLGRRIAGKTLGSIAPASGLEAFVRDARSSARDRFRFEVSARQDRARRSLSACVVPIAAGDLDARPTRRVVHLKDASRQSASAMIDGPLLARRHLSVLIEAAQATYRPGAIAGSSHRAQELRRRVVEASGHARPILISGERGVGKQLVARILHYSGTASGSILQMRCGGRTEDVLEKELFGYVKGAFKGAVADRPGLFLLSRDGTLVLDDVDDLPLTLQRLLVEVVDKGSVLRRGARRRDRIDLRLIMTTATDIAELTRAGRFLPELQRLITRDSIVVPPLRERLEDLPELASLFLARAGRHPAIALDDEALWVMQQYDWPGNVSELEDCVEQACTRVEAGRVRVEHLTRTLRELLTELPQRDLVPPIRVAGDDPARPSVSRARSRSSRAWDITDEDPINLDFYERQLLVRALHSCDGDRLAAARLLEVGKSTLYRKLKRFGIK